MADDEEVRPGRRRAAAAQLLWFPDVALLLRRRCEFGYVCAPLPRLLRAALALLSAMGGGAALA